MSHPWLRRLPAAHPKPASAEDIIEAIRTVQEAVKAKPRIVLTCHPDDIEHVRAVEAWAEQEGLWVTIEVQTNKYIPQGQVFSMDAARLESILDLTPPPPAAKPLGMVEEWLEGIREDLEHKRASSDPSDEAVLADLDDDTLAALDEELRNIGFEP